MNFLLQTRRMTNAIVEAYPNVPQSFIVTQLKACLEGPALVWADSCDYEGSIELFTRLFCAEYLSADYVEVHKKEMADLVLHRYDAGSLERYVATFREKALLLTIISGSDEHEDFLKSAILKNIHLKAAEWIGLKAGVGPHVTYEAIIQSLSQLLQVLERQDDPQQQLRATRGIEKGGISEATFVETMNRLQAALDRNEPDDSDVATYTINAMRTGPGMIKCIPCSIKERRRIEFQSPDCSPGVTQRCPKCQHEFTFSVRPASGGNRNGKTNYKRSKEASMQKLNALSGAGNYEEMFEDEADDDGEDDDEHSEGAEEQDGDPSHF